MFIIFLYSDTCFAILACQSLAYCHTHEMTLTVNVYTSSLYLNAKVWLTVTHCTSPVKTSLTVNMYTSSVYLYAKVLAHCHTHGNCTYSECVNQLSLSLCQNLAHP